MEILVSADLGFSVADGEAITLSFDAGDLTLTFKDWREQSVQHRFVETLAFRWAARPTLVTPRDDSTYEVDGSVWLLDELELEGYSASEQFVHHVLCFNAAKVLESPRVSQRLRKLGEWKPWQGRASSHRRFESELSG